MSASGGSRPSSRVGIKSDSSDPFILDYGSLDNAEVQKMEAVSQGRMFSTSYGAIFSFMGTVVGCGNLWRFPRIAAITSGDRGCLVFLICWVIFLFLWSTPILLIEMTIGKYTRSGVVTGFRKLGGDNAIWAGGWVAVASFFVMSYFSVIVGWCIYYVIQGIAFELPSHFSDSLSVFTYFTQETYWPLALHACVGILSGLAVFKGAGTIEKVNLVLIPLLLVIVLVTFIWSLTRENAVRGIKFIFTPNWEQFLDPNTWKEALTQNAFDTAGGMGLFIAYAAFLPPSKGVVRQSYLIPVCNNLISLTSLVSTFSTAFSSLTAAKPNITDGEILKVMKETGPGSTGMTFVWMPILFSYSGEAGRVFAALYFICLISAGLSSTVSSIELLTHILEDFGVRRKFGTWVAVLAQYLIGLGSALSLEYLTNQDFVWPFALIISGLMLLGLVIKFGVSKFREDCVNVSDHDWKVPYLWEWLIRLITPILAVGLIIWWAVNLIDKTEKNGGHWYDVTTESFMMTILQWLGALLILISINIFLVKFQPNWFLTGSIPYSDIAFSSGYASDLNSSNGFLSDTEAEEETLLQSQEHPKKKKSRPVFY